MKLTNVSAPAGVQGAFLLLVATSGTGRIKLGYREFEWKPGRVFFIPDGAFFRAPGGKGRSLHFQVNHYRAMVEANPIIAQLYSPFNANPFIDLDESAANVYELIFSLLKQETEDDEFILQGYLRILLGHAACLSPLVSIIHPAQAALYQLLSNLLEANFATQRRTAWYSAQLHITPRRLNKLHKQVTGKLIPEYIMSRLLSEAERLLATTTLSIKEITYQLGFTDHAHFCYFFRKYKGTKPTAFRKQQGKKQKHYDLSPVE